MSPYRPELIRFKMSRVIRKSVFGVSTRSDTNRAVQTQQMVRGLKFRIYEVKGENKGADQLRGNHAADRLFCRIC